MKFWREQRAGATQREPDGRAGSRSGTNCKRYQELFGTPEIYLPQAILCRAIEAGDLNLVSYLLGRSVGLGVENGISPLQPQLAAANERRPRQLVERLLTEDPALRVTDDVLERALKNPMADAQLIDKLCARRLRNETSEGVLLAIANNRERGAEFLQILMSAETNTIFPER